MPPSRYQLRNGIKGCTNCELSAKVTPVPFSGPQHARIAVLGESPGREETKQGFPFVGPAGKVAREWLAISGVDPDSVAWLNAVCCWPIVDGKPTNPGRTHIARCSGNLVAQLRYISPEVMLVMGNVAASVWWPKITIGALEGWWWKAKVRGMEEPPWCIATWHPAAWLRKQQGSIRNDALESIANLVLGPGVGGHANEMCFFRCGELAEEWVGDLGWCRYHRPVDSRKYVIRELVAGGSRTEQASFSTH